MIEVRSDRYEDMTDGLEYVEMGWLNKEGLETEVEDSRREALAKALASGKLDIEQPEVDEEAMACPMQIEGQWECIGVRCQWFKVEEDVGRCSVESLSEVRELGVVLYNILDVFKELKWRLEDGRQDK